MSNYPRNPYSCYKCGLVFRENLPMNITAIKGQGPRPGDIGICLGCGRINIYKEGGVRAPTIEEKKLVDGNEEIQETRRMLLAREVPAIGYEPPI